MKGGGVMKGEGREEHDEKGREIGSNEKEREGRRVMKRGWREGE